MNCNRSYAAGCPKRTYLLNAHFVSMSTQAVCNSVAVILILKLCSERKRERKEGRKEGRRSRSRSREVGAETPAPSPEPGGCARSPAAARHPRPCSAVGRQEPRLPATLGYPLPGRAGIEIKASRIKRSPPARLPPHLQLASRRTPIHPPTLTWSWRPTPAWREDPRPARGEGWAGTKGEKSCQAS